MCLFLCIMLEDGFLLLSCLLSPTNALKTLPKEMCQLLLTPDLHQDFQILHRQSFHYLDSSRFLSYYKVHFGPSHYLFELY